MVAAKLVLMTLLAAGIGSQNLGSQCLGTHAAISVS